MIFPSVLTFFIFKNKRYITFRNKTFVYFYIIYRIRQSNLMFYMEMLNRFLLFMETECSVVKSNIKILKSKMALYMYIIKSSEIKYLS